MTRRRTLFLRAIGILAALTVAPLLYLGLSDLGGWRDTVARVASNAMGRELRIAGEFEVDLGIVTRVHATELRLANADWSSEPTMASIDRLDAEINLRELVSGSIHLPNVEIEGGRAVFESDPEAGSNWRLGKGDSSGNGGPVRLRIDRIKGSDVTLVFGNTNDEHHVDLIVDTIDSSGDPEGMHQLTGAGALQASDFTISGSFGSFAELINLEPFDHDLRVTLGSSQLSSKGRIGRIVDLGDLDLEARATVPHPTEIYRLLGLSFEFERPLDLRASTSTTHGLTDFTLTAEGDAADLSATGTIDSVLSPTNLDVRVELGGPDIRPVAALTGITDLQALPFDLVGRFTWRGHPIEVSGLEIRVGENWIAADGDLGQPPVMLETDLRLKGAGPNVAEVAALAGLHFPPDRYEFDGRLLRVEDGLQLHDVRVRIGRTRLTTSGFVGDPPQYENTDLGFAIEGPDLAHYRSAFGHDLPTVPFAVSGRLAEGDRSIALDDVMATVGSGNFEVDGRLTTVAGMVGTDLSIVAHGGDLSLVGEITGITGLPATPFHATGRATVTPDGLRLQGIAGQAGSIDLALDGLLTKHRKAGGSKFDFRISGADLSTLDAIVPDLELPAEPFHAAGRLELLATGLGLEGVELGLGDATGRVSGVIGLPWRLNPTDLEFDVGGPSLAVVDRLIPSIRPPAAGFSLSGGLRLTDGAVEIREVDVGIAGSTAHLNGTATLGDNPSGATIEASLDCPDLRSLGTLIAASSSLEIPTLPAGALSVAGNVVIDENGIHLPSLSLTLGEASATLAGDMGRWPDLVGADLTVHADGPDASLLATLTDADVPVAPFKLDGRLRRFDAGHTFDQLTASLGDYRFKIDGTVGSLPKLIGTDVELQIEGPDLTLIRDLSGIAALPPGDFALTGHFEGEPNRFKSDATTLRLGTSDLSGSFRVDFEGKPRVTGRLQSRHVDLSDFRPSTPASGNEPDPSDTADESAGFVISDEPLHLAFLDKFDLDLGWDIAKGEYFFDDGRDLFVSVILEDGRVRVDRFEATGKLGGKVRGTASLIPVAGGHRLTTEFHIEEGMINLAGDGADPSEYTPVDLLVELSAVGRTAHEMAASADGRISLTITGGTLKKGILDLLSADVLVALARALNPFAEDEPTTKLNCAVLVARFEDGMMTLDPAAVQTDKVTILGDGTVDFKTEKLRLDWITKPRKGIGISASMFTNPYIRLGGSLSHPNIEMKPMEALATTGVAVVTMGISLVAKGFFDRVTAEKKVCEQAMAQAEKQLQPAQPKKQQEQP